MQNLMGARMDSTYGTYNLTALSRLIRIEKYKCGIIAELFIHR